MSAQEAIRKAFPMSDPSKAPLDSKVLAEQLAFIKVQCGEISHEEATEMVAEMNYYHRRLIEQLATKVSEELVACYEDLLTIIPSYELLE
jgi:flavorubredoxin